MASTLLVRHAQASFGTDTYDRLSELGVQQAVIAGEYLGATAGPIARIISGPLSRQRATAAEIAARVRDAAGRMPEVEIDPGLDELQIDGHIERIVPRLEDPDGELARHLAEAKTSSRSYQKVIRRVFTCWQQLDQDTGGESWLAFAARARMAMHIIQRNSTIRVTLQP
jgi:broad specificity phosphatase PhoE